jgi:uncharacterized protein (TIGR00730 family)
MHITVFGGSQPKPGEASYEEALLLGRLLGERGHTVITGGYIGAMEAVSRGAAESGAHVIGVTCAQIEAWRPVKPNPWVIEEVRRETLLERLQTLIESCQAAIALPGGPGTLTEIALTWNLLLTAAIPPIPLILIGAGWQATWQAFYQALGEYVPENQRSFLSFAPNAHAAARMLDELCPR